MILILVFLEYVYQRRANRSVLSVCLITEEFKVFNILVSVCLMVIHGERYLLAILFIMISFLPYMQ